MITTQNVSLLELNGYYLNGDNIFFYCKDKIIECNKDNLYKLIDPVYDQTFKSLFLFGNKCNDIFGQQRLISFLNSIISSKYGERIKCIEYLPNKLIKGNEKTKLGMRIVDIVVKATFESEKILYIDIEIQTSFYRKICKRWVEYACRLFSNVEHETLVLVLQLGDEENDWYSIAPKKKENIAFHLEEKVDGKFEIISIDLQHAIASINKNFALEFEGVNVSEEGRIWLKLLGLRFWIKPALNNYYILPYNLKASPEIMSAIHLLSQYTPNQVTDIIRLENRRQSDFEDAYYVCEENMEENYTVKLWMSLYQNGLTNSPHFKELGKVRENKVRLLCKGDSHLENFILFLSQIGKLK